MVSFGFLLLERIHVRLRHDDRSADTACALTVHFVGGLLAYLAAGAVLPTEQGVSFPVRLVEEVVYCPDPDVLVFAPVLFAALPRCSLIEKAPVEPFVRYQ
jgi:hypothetical protein